MDKEGSFRGIFIVMIVSLLIAFLWDGISSIRDTAHAILDPTAGALLGMNLNLGMTILVLIIATIMTLAQKYGTDQKTLKEMKEQQKSLQKEMKEFRDHPEKMLSLQKKQMEFIPKMFKLSMRPIIYTAIPLILFFRWFGDFFSLAGDPKIFGFFSWFWFYLLGSIVFSSILRKVLKVA